MWDVAVWLDVFSAVKCGAVSSEFDASFLFSIHLAIYIVQPPCHNAVAARSYPIHMAIHATSIVTRSGDDPGSPNGTRSGQASAEIGS